MASTIGTHEIARRYARAFLALAEDQGKVDQVAEDMQRLKMAVDEVPELAALAGNATIDRAQQGKAMAAVAQELKCTELTKNLLGVIAEKRRLGYLGAIADAALAMIAEKRGEITADVISAQKLDDQQIETIASALSKQLDKKVKVNVTLDDAIMGGLVVRVGSHLIDSSVRTKLERLARALTSDKLSSENKMKEVA